jgi:hypothetical protein
LTAGQLNTQSNAVKVVKSDFAGLPAATCLESNHKRRRIY